MNKNTIEPSSTMKGGVNINPKTPKPFKKLYTTKELLGGKNKNGEIGERS